MSCLNELQMYVTNQLDVLRFNYFPGVTSPFIFKGFNPKRGGNFEEERYKLPISFCDNFLLAGNVGGEKPSDYARSVHFYNVLFREQKLRAVAFGFDVDDLFEDFLDTVVRNASRFLLLHITDPYKTRAFQYVMKKQIPLSDSARISGVVNPLIFGKGVIAENVDGYAMLESIEAHGSIRDSNVVLIGAGGGASSIALEVANRIAGGRLVILNRTPEKAHDLGKRLRERSKSEIITGGIDLLGKYSSDSAFVISAVTNNPYLSEDIIRGFPTGTFFADINYGASARVASTAKAAGYSAIDGGPMVYYGVERAAKLAFKRAGLELKDAALALVRKEAGL